MMTKNEVFVWLVVVSERFFFSAVRPVQPAERGGGGGDWVVLLVKSGHFGRGRANRYML